MLSNNCKLKLVELLCGEIDQKKRFLSLYYDDLYVKDVYSKDNKKAIQELREELSELKKFKEELEK